MSSALRPISGSFAIGSSTTDPITLDQYTLCGVTTGSTLSSTSLTFLVSSDGTTYYPLYDDTGTEILITTTTAARAFALQPQQFFPWGFVKLRQGTSASAVLQASNNTNVSFLLRSI